MADVSTIFTDRWATGQHVGVAKPGIRAEIQTGRFDRAHAPWDDAGHPISATIATSDPTMPWQATWTPSSAWIALPNVLDCEREKSFDNTNGLETCTLTIENIIYTAQTGNWHKTERGYLAPLRGYVAAGRDPLLDYDGSAVSENEWFQKLGRKILLRVWESYGDEESKVFIGMTDGIDLTSRPDRIVITARAAKWLTEEEFFGWNKDPNTGREPVIFIDREDATNIKLVGYSATDSSDDGTHTADMVLDGDGDTMWRSQAHGVDDVTEWVEIRVPQGLYTDFIYYPDKAGSDVYVSVFAKKWTDDAGNLQLPLKDGVQIPEGWVGDFAPAAPVRVDWTGSVAIPDNDPTGASVTLSVADSGTITDVEVLFYITHTWDGDLTVHLTAPDGTTTCMLVDREGDSGDNFGSSAADANMTDLFDGATTTLASGSPPYVGSFKPDEALSVFRDLSITGDWTFKVVDHAGGDVGTIHAASVIFTIVQPSDPVPGAFGGIPYTKLIHGPSVGSHTEDIGFDLTMGKGSIIRLSQRYYGTYSGDYQAAFRTLIARKRTLITTHAASLWVLVDDITDVVKVILRWAGFKEWDVESAGTKLSKRLLFGKGDKYQDAINKIRDALGYTFFVADPSSADASLGIPVFRKSLVVADNIAPKIAIKDTDLLTEIKVNQDDENLAYIIRVRGRQDPQGQTLGSDPARRIQYTYRPPWSGSPSAGVIRHLVYVNSLFKTVDQCKLAAYYIALEEALTTYSAVTVIPGYPGIDLDDFIELQDLGTGLTTRLWIAERQSKFSVQPPQDIRFTGGSEMMYQTTITGALVDVPDVQDIVTLINATVLG